MQLSASKKLLVEKKMLRRKNPPNFANQHNCAVDPTKKNILESSSPFSPVFFVICILRCFLMLAPFVCFIFGNDEKQIYFRGLFFRETHFAGRFEVLSIIKREAPCERTLLNEKKIGRKYS